MNKITKAAAAAALAIPLAAVAPHADAALISRGSVWDTKGASIYTQWPDRVLHQGEHANGVEKFRLRYDSRCVYVYTGTPWSTGYYKAKPNRTHPTHGYGIQAFARAKCGSRAKWISAVLG